MTQETISYMHMWDYVLIQLQTSNGDTYRNERSTDHRCTEFLEGPTLPCLQNKGQFIIRFVLIVNIHFWNYYSTSRAYPREPPFNHLESNSSEFNYPCILALTIVIAPIFAGMKNSGIWKHSSLRSDPQPSHPRTPSPYSQLTQIPLSKASFTLRRTNPRSHVTLEDLFPCVSQNIFSVHSPCFSFSIAATHSFHPTPSRWWCERQDTF